LRLPILGESRECSAGPIPVRCPSMKCQSNKLLIRGLTIPRLGKGLGKDGFKTHQNAPKCLRTASAHRRDFLLCFQGDLKNFEEDRKSRAQILSLLRMPISPLRRDRKQTTYRMLPLSAASGDGDFSGRLCLRNVQSQ